MLNSCLDASLCANSRHCYEANWRLTQNKCEQIAHTENGLQPTQPADCKECRETCLFCYYLRAAGCKVCPRLHCLRIQAWFQTKVLGMIRCLSLSTSQIRGHKVNFIQRHPQNNTRFYFLKNFLENGQFSCHRSVVFSIPIACGLNQKRQCSWRNVSLSSSVFWIMCFQ